MKMGSQLCLTNMVNSDMTTMSIGEVYMMSRTEMGVTLTYHTDESNLKRVIHCKFIKYDRLGMRNRDDNITEGFNILQYW